MGQMSRFVLSLFQTGIDGLISQRHQVYRVVLTTQNYSEVIGVVCGPAEEVSKGYKA